MLILLEMSRYGDSRKLWLGASFTLESYEFSVLCKRSVHVTDLMPRNGDRFRLWPVATPSFGLDDVFLFFRLTFLNSCLC